MKALPYRRHKVGQAAIRKGLDQRKSASLEQAGSLRNSSKLPLVWTAGTGQIGAKHDSMGEYHEPSRASMEYFKIVVGGVCLSYVAVGLFLEWTHHITVIEERWPRWYKRMTDRKTMVVLLFVGLGLFVEILTEKRSEQNITTETHVVAPHTPVSNHQDANNSPCANVNGNGPITINCSPSEKQSANPSKPKKPASK
jgi:hypothetical protein